MDVYIQIKMILCLKDLKLIYDRLDTLIKLYKPDSMAIEGLFYFKNQKTVIKVGQARE